MPRPTLHAACFQTALREMNSSARDNGIGMKKNRQEAYSVSTDQDADGVLKACGCMYSFGEPHPKLHEILSL